MKVLILSSGMGSGHNACAAAIREELERREVPCSLEDALRFASDKVSETVCATYVGVTTRAPKLFYRLYRAGRAISNPRLKSPVYFANQLYRERLYDYIVENGFDTVVTTHLFPAETLTSLRRRGKAPFFSVFVMTDYTCIPFVEETECNALVIPHEELWEEFLGRGVPASSMYCYGIPVGESFRHRRPKEEARLELGLPDAGPVYLIMSGSMGFGHVADLTGELLKRVGGTAQIVVLCGNNRDLLDQVNKRFSDCANVSARPYTEQVPLFMDACDVLFTKPGGLTTSEAAAKNIPLIHTEPIPGCETMNARFFSERGMSAVGASVEEEAALAVELVNDPVIRERMLSAQRRYFHSDAAGRVCDLIEKRGE